MDQEPVLFAGTVEENIRYGVPSATTEQVEEAARQVRQPFPFEMHRLLTAFKGGRHIWRTIVCFWCIPGIEYVLSSEGAYLEGHTLCYVGVFAAGMFL